MRICQKKTEFLRVYAHVLQARASKLRARQAEAAEVAEAALAAMRRQPADRLPLLRTALGRMLGRTRSDASEWVSLGYRMGYRLSVQYHAWYARPSRVDRTSKPNGRKWSRTIVSRALLATSVSARGAPKCGGRSPPTSSYFAGDSI